jgi:uncharacterized protein (TIGR02246 family)
MSRPFRKVCSQVFLAILGFSWLLQAGAAQERKKPSIEVRLRALEDREEIRRLLIEYGQTLDRRDFAGFSRLFAENAEYVGGASSGIKGAAAIAKLLEETFKKNPTGVRNPNFHLFANEIIQVRGNEATALSKGMFVVPNAGNAPEIVMMATYEDVLIRDGGRWKFKRRVVHADIPAPAPLQEGA